MIKFRLKENMIVGLPEEVAQDYQPKENEIVVDTIPHVSLEEGQMAYMYWENNQIKYVIKEKEVKV